MLAEKRSIERLDKRNIKTYIDGKCLEDNIEGFVVDAVFGRSVVKRDSSIQTSDTGAYVRYNKFDKRDITVVYNLKAKDNTTLMRRFETLNMLLETDSKDVEVRFSDDKYVYYGQVTEVDFFEDTTNWVVGRFTITCCDCKKYGDTVEIKNLTKFNYSHLYSVVPDKFVIHCTVDSDKVRIDNTSNSGFIEIQGVYKAGDTVVIDVRNQSIMKGSENYLKYLNIGSNLEDFRLRHNDVISCTNCTVDITYREVRI